MKFTARKTFESKETNSTYVKGMSYTARTPELQKLAEKWRKAGKVTIDAGAAGTTATIKGK